MQRAFILGIWLFALGNAVGSLAEEAFDDQLQLAIADPDPTNSPPLRRDVLLPYHIEHGPMKYLEWVWKDPINLVTRPAFWGGNQWRTFGIETAIVGALFPADEPVRDVFQDNRSTTITDIVDPIRNFYTGDVLELYGVGLFATGLILKNEKLADSGFLAAESVFYATQFSGILKKITERERPRSAENQYEFNGPGGSTRHGGSSFVSGEVIGAYAFAASVSEVWQNPWVTWPLYGLAGVVAVHRLEHDGHWLTDCVAAGFLGHAIGKSIVRFHYKPDQEAKVTPFVTQDSVGLQVSFRF